MNIQTQIRQLLTTLSAKQQTLDFGDSSLWQQLPELDRRACYDAIAALLYQVATTNQHFNQENHQDE